MRQKNTFLIVCSALLCVACSSTLPSFKSYKLDIQQGNVVTSKMIEQVHKGMTKSQVKYVLGTPLIQDSFHRDRWDYFYQYRHDGKVTQQNRVILEFKDDVLVNIAGDPVPEGTIDPASMPKSDVMLEQADKRPFVEKLKFWKSDETKQTALNKAKETKEAPTEVANAAAQAEEKEAAATTKGEPEKVENASLAVPEQAASSVSLLAVPVEAAAVDAVVSAPEDKPSVTAEVQETKQPQEVASKIEAESPVANANSVAQQAVAEAQVVDTAAADTRVEQAAPVEAPVAVVAPANVASELVEQEPVDTQYNPTLAQPMLMLDKRLKQFSDKPIAKINATPDIPPQLILSRTLADAPSLLAPVSDLSVKPAPSTQVPQSIEEPGMFERMLEKIGF